MSLLSQPLCHHVSTKLSHLKLAQSQVCLYLYLTQSQLPQSQIFLAYSQTYPFQPCLQSQTQPILDTPDFKLFIFQTRLVSWFVQHTNVLQHKLVRLMPKTFRVAMYQYNKK